tara:strand:- start:19 stop:192 length:174 start_codon:yes stop_codon:yes gene_type:complete
MAKKKKITKAQVSSNVSGVVLRLSRMFNDKMTHGRDSHVKASTKKLLDLVEQVQRIR